MSDFEFGILSLKVARILVTEPARPHWTYDIAKRVAVNRGSAHRVLTQFRDNGWLVDRPLPGERPKTIRVAYELTKDGADALSAALSPFQMLPSSTWAGTNGSAVGKHPAASRPPAMVKDPNREWYLSIARTEADNAAWLRSYLAVHSSAHMPSQRMSS